MFDSSRLPNVDNLNLEHPGAVTYASHMAARENALQAIFGPTEPPDRILAPGDPNVLLNWPGGGIYQFPPGHGRRSWHYVTSGLSQPSFDKDNKAESVVDDDGERYSGDGIELVMSTREQAMWAPDVLLNLVRYLLFQKNSRIILPGDRLPCNGPLVLNTNTQLNHLVATTSTEYESEILLPAGKCELVHLIGITQGELDQALTEGIGSAGSIILCRVMQQMGVGFDSIPERDCLTRSPEFPRIWQQAKAECEAKWVRPPAPDA